MRVAVECKSPLLQKSLELFLSRYLSSTKKSDIVVRDVKCINDKRCFYISSDKEADLVKPFSKSQLILALENKFESSHGKIARMKDELEQTPQTTMDFDILEKRINSLTLEYQSNILKAVRAFYED